MKAGPKRSRLRVLLKVEEGKSRGNGVNPVSNAGFWPIAGQEIRLLLRRGSSRRRGGSGRGSHRRMARRSGLNDGLDSMEFLEGLVAGGDGGVAMAAQIVGGAEHFAFHHREIVNGPLGEKSARPAEASWRLARVAHGRVGGGVARGRLRGSARRRGVGLRRSVLIKKNGESGDGEAGHYQRFKFHMFVVRLMPARRFGKVEKKLMEGL